MTGEAVRGAQTSDEFSRLHKLFVEHLGLATGVAWIAAIAAAMQAPWLRNIRGLIDPAGPAESTASFLFGLPAVMTIAWLSAAFGRGAMRKVTMFRNLRVEFAVAGLAAFAVFCLAAHRVALALSLAP